MTNASAALRNFPALPCSTVSSNGSVSLRVSTDDATTSATAPTPASARAGPLFAVEVVTNAAPADAHAAEETNRLGSSLCASCHMGTDVLPNSTAV